MRPLVHCSIISLVTVLGFADPSLSEMIGPVVSVLDGDTIEVLNGHHTERIRLSGIDCPEKGQAFGKRAK